MVKKDTLNYLLWTSERHLIFSNCALPFKIIPYNPSKPKCVAAQHRQFRLAFCLTIICEILPL